MSRIGRYFPLSSSAGEMKIGPLEEWRQSRRYRTRASPSETEFELNALFLIWCREEPHGFSKMSRLIVDSDFERKATGYPAFPSNGVMCRTPEKEKTRPGPRPSSLKESSRPSSGGSVSVSQPSILNGSAKYLAYWSEWQDSNLRLPHPEHSA